MMRRAMLGLAVFCLLAVLPAVAGTKRGIGIPLPGLRDELVVKVIELPKSLELIRELGRHVELGYKFNSGSGGEWVGYIGPDEEYVRLKPEAMSLILRLADLLEPPPVPDRPWEFFDVLWIGFGAVVLIGLMRQRFGKLRGFDDPAALGADTSREAKMAAALAAASSGQSGSPRVRGFGGGVPVQAAPEGPQVLSSRQAMRAQLVAADALRSGFGRRG